MSNRDTPNEAFTLGEKKQELDLDAIMEAEAADASREHEAIKSVRSKKALKITGIAGGIAAGVAAVVVGVIVFNPFGGDQTVGTGGPGTVDNSKGTTYTSITNEWWQKEDNLYPIKLEDWQKRMYSADQAPSIGDAILAKQAGTPNGRHASVLPLEAAGFTSSLDETMLDGAQNPLFSFWTDELFQKETGIYLERFLNPKFGGWEPAQYLASEFTGGGMNDMFTDRWLSNEGTSARSYPVFLDWNDNDYGLSGTLLATGSRWMGEATAIRTSFTYDEAAQQYSAQLVADVKYTAWTVDQTSIEKTGVLTLNLVANPENTKGTSSQRVLIDSATLEVN
jgi:hypothetical protein